MPARPSNSTTTRRSERISKRPQPTSRSPTKREPKRRKRTQRAAKRPVAAIEPPEDPGYADTTDSWLVTKPVEKFVHKSLSLGWAINQENPMWYIFDAHSPARHFKRGVPFDEKSEFPMYGKKPYVDLTETDEPPPGLMPYRPWNHTPRYKLECVMDTANFMSWERGELRTIVVGTTVSIKVDRKTRTDFIKYQVLVPAPYDRIVAQLIAEDIHAKTDSGHEVLRRQTYAQVVLDKFWKEIKGYKGEAVNFRSKVLTPILQRQLWGVEENYGPALRLAVAGAPKNPTIAQATQFYLENDPTDPDWIPTFRRNLIYIPEARWHLGFVLGNYTVDDVTAYDSVRKNIDQIYKSMQKIAAIRARNKAAGKAAVEPKPTEDTEVPELGILETYIIFSEHLDDFFEPELKRVPESVAEAKARLGKKYIVLPRPLQQDQTLLAGPSTATVDAVDDDDDSRYDPSIHEEAVE